MKARGIVFCILFGIVTGGAYLGCSDDDRITNGSNGPLGDIELIKSVIKKLEAAYNSHDSLGVAENFTDDFLHSNKTEFLRIGFFEGLDDPLYEITITDIQPTNSGNQGRCAFHLARVHDGTVDKEGDYGPDGIDLGVHHFRKEDGMWKIRGNQMGDLSPEDSLTLRKFKDLHVWSECRSGNWYIVFMTFAELHDSLTAYIHQPDITDWAVVTPLDQLSKPASRGIYTGDIDRTILFRATTSGLVGGPNPVEIRFTIFNEQQWSGELDVGLGYAAEDWIPVVFTESSGGTLDLGVEISFSAGMIDAQGQFIVGCEDYEGFQVLRGNKPDGSDLAVIGELSKEEANSDSYGGGGFDSLYYHSILPDLREHGVHDLDSPIGCVGNRITLALDHNEFFWFDQNAVGGHTYYYTVTPCDREYDVPTGRHGLLKDCLCEPIQGHPLTGSCLDWLVRLELPPDRQN